MKGARALSGEEIRVIASHLRLRDKCLFMVGIRTGLRIGEILSINIEDTIEENGLIKTEIKIHKKNTKGKVEGRRILLHEEVRSILKEYLTKEPGSVGPLFRARVIRGIKGRLDQSVFHKAIKKASKEGGLENISAISSHSMRKSFAERMYKALGNDMLDLQKAMGHKSLSNTAAYVSENWEKILKAIKTLNTEE